MSKTPFFTIITASYNSQKTISKTIESVLNQTFIDFEFIIVDGNSQDETVKIIESYASNFETKGIAFKYISENDKGIYDAWNKGLKMSTGKWISYVGSDDFYLLNALERYYFHICQNDDINYISSQIQLINEKGEDISIVGKAYNWEKVIRDIDTAQLGSFHKRELFDLTGNFSLKYKIVGDLDFYIRCKNFIKPAYFKEITAKMQNGGVSNQIYIALKEALLVKQEYKYLPSYINYYNFYWSLAKCYIKILIKKK